MEFGNAFKGFCLNSTYKELKLFFSKTSNFLTNCVWIVPTRNWNNVSVKNLCVTYLRLNSTYKELKQVKIDDFIIEIKAEVENYCASERSTKDKKGYPLIVKEYLYHLNYTVQSVWYKQQWIPVSYTHLTLPTN